MESVEYLINKLITKINKMAKTTSPKGGNRGCLGKDGKYAIENCTGELSAQGVGSTVQQGSATITVIDGVKTIVRSNG
jgi:hypothetical protein